VSDDWNFYFCNVNAELASIFLDLDLRKSIPDPKRAWLLWVWVYFNSPRPDGLSSSEEFEILDAIEKKLTASIAEHCDAILAGRITTCGRREFYYYASKPEAFENAVDIAMTAFPEYEFDWDTQADQEWRQYLDVLYPSDENLQRIKNRDLLEVIKGHGDPLEAPRDIWHWSYFPTEADRKKFRDEIERLGYRSQSQSEVESGEERFGICIVKWQSMDQQAVDDTVIELLRTTQLFDGSYDGWETEVIKSGDASKTSAPS